MSANRIVIKLLEDVMGPMSNGNGAPEPEPESKPTPTISIGTIFNALPPGVDEQVMAILNGVNDTIEMAKQLKVLLRQHEAALDSIGLIPDYTAYMLTAVAQQQRGIP